MPPVLGSSPRRSAGRLARRLSLTTASVVLVAATVGGCDDARDVAAQRFTPSTPGVLTVAVTLPAPGYWDVDDQGAAVGGFEFELARALADRFDLELEWREVPFDRLVVGDLDGADLALAQISVTDERRSVLQFSTPYYESGAGVVAASGDDIVDLATARDRTWGVVGGSTEEDLVRDVVRPDVATVFADELSCVESVAQGAVEACLLDLPTALVLEHEVEGVATVARFITREQWAVALRTDAPAATANIAAVDAAIRALTSTGALDSFAAEWLESRFARNPDVLAVIEARV